MAGQKVAKDFLGALPLVLEDAQLHPLVPAEREFLIDNLLVRIQYTNLAKWAKDSQVADRAAIASPWRWRRTMLGNVSGPSRVTRPKSCELALKLADWPRFKWDRPLGGLGSGREVPSAPPENCLTTNRRIRGHC